MSNPVCPNCGHSIDKWEVHSCLSAQSPEHDAECDCVYCELEREFADMGLEDRDE